MLLLTALAKFLVVVDLYVAFSHDRKRSKGRKNKLEGCTLAMSDIYFISLCLNFQVAKPTSVKFAGRLKPPSTFKSPDPETWPSQTTGVNFTKVVPTAFTLIDPNSVKKYN